MQKSINIFSFDTVIFFLLFGLLPIDMLNGFLLKEIQINYVISISQFYKIILLALLFIRVSSVERIITLSLFSLLLLPSFFQFFKSFDFKLILIDLVKIIKYLASILAFFYFRRIFIYKRFLLKSVYKWMFFSFGIIVINIFLRLFNLGFPMYKMHGLEIGSKGFFYAGNEISATLLIVSSFLLFWFKLHKKRILFMFIGFLAIVTSLYITSKTAILGSVLTLIYMQLLNPSSSKISAKTIFFYIIFFLFIIPIGTYSIISYLDSSDFMTRASYYWDRLDFYTFIFSSRNIYLFDFIDIYKKEYNIFEMFFGVGQSTFENLNNDTIIELDFFDIYFAYGLIGVILFVFYILYILINIKLKTMRSNIFIFSSYSMYISVLLITLSFFSGHIFNSGMAAVFIGCVFALMYYNSNYENKIS